MRTSHVSHRLVLYSFVVGRVLMGSAVPGARGIKT